MVVKFYGYRRCKTCRDVESLFKSSKMRYEFIDLLKTPPGFEILQKAFEKYGAAGLVRQRRSQIEYDRLGLRGFLNKLISEPTRLKRPIVVSGDEVYVGKDALKLLEKGVKRVVQR
ncbi:MAG: hypothetical protein QXW60_01600 [Nitrososphaerota archaeon]